MTATLARPGAASGAGTRSTAAIDAWHWVHDGGPLLIVRQVGSEVGLEPKRRANLRSGLGLRGVGRFKIHRSTREIYGMIAKVEDLVEVEELGRHRETLTASRHRTLPTDGSGRAVTVTETRYETTGGNAVAYRDGESSVHGQYLAAERYDGFFTIAWTSPLTLSGALERFLVVAPSPARRPRRKAVQAILIDEDGVHILTAARAVSRVRLQGDGVHLFRLEYPDYTFVWREPLGDHGEGLAEVALMCTTRDDAFVTSVMEDTATEGLAAQAKELVDQAVGVVGTETPSTT
jgi:ribosomal protein L30